MTQESPQDVQGTGLDENFYKRADAFINLANSQCADTVPGRVSASMMFGVARFNAWVAAASSLHAQEMQDRRQETIDYLVAQYRMMLTEHLDDHIANFSKYMKPIEG